MPPMLDVHIRHVFDVIDRAGAPVSEGSLQRLSDLSQQWLVAKAELRDITQNELHAINEWAKSNDIEHIFPIIKATALHQEKSTKAIME